MTQEPQPDAAVAEIDALKARLVDAIGGERIEVLNELAGSYQELPPKQRMAFAEQAIDLSEELHDQKSTADAYNHLGVAYNNAGNSQRSFECFFKALQIMEEISDQGGIAYSHTCIGQAHFYQNNFDRALQHFQRALEVRESIGDKQDVSQTLILIGNVKAKTTQYEEAIDYYSRALAVKEEVGDQGGISQIFTNLANVYLATGRMDAVLKYRLDSLRIDRELGDSWEIALTTYNIAEYYLNVKQPDEAHPYILESQELAQKLGNKGLLRDNLDNMALYHELRGEYQDALKCQRDHSELTETLFTEELAEKTTEMQVKYETAQLEDLVKEKTDELQRNMERLQASLAGTIRALATTVETRDPYTAGHQQRVSKLACAIAESMGLPENQSEGVRLAGIIHDIGKISVPAEVLSTPRRLTDIEFSLIKNHSQVGREILRDIDFSVPVADIVLQHHERMDGSGYPNGVKGDEILLEARIIAVADVVEAMASHRPYRAALGVDKALDEIFSNKGTLYDSDVVDACLKLFAESKFEFED